MAAATPSAKSITEDYSCGYCLQRWSYMVDPRALPCSHVFCWPCIQGDFAKWAELKCGICQVSHSVKDINELPKAKLSDVAPPPAISEYVCQVCKEPPENAESFCVECGKMLCQLHLERHEESKIFFNTEHRLIPLDVFRHNPSLYKSVKCGQHAELKLTRACTCCYKTFCDRCGADTEGCLGGKKGRHELRPIPSFVRLLEAGLSDQLKVLSEKVTDISKIEKEAWQLLSDVEEKVKEMRAAVRKRKEEKISAILEESEKLEAEIQDYLESSRKQVEDLSALLLVKRERMERLWKSTRHAMKVKANSELIEQFEDVKSELEAARNVPILSCSLKSKDLTSAVRLPANNGEIGLGLTDLPKHICLQDVKTQEGTKIYTARITKDGKLLCGSNRGPQIRDLASLDILNSVATKDILYCDDIIQTADRYLIVLRFETKSGYTVQLSETATKSLKIKNQLIEKQQKSILLWQLAENGADIYVVDQENRKMLVLSLISRNVTAEIDLEDIEGHAPASISVLPDSSILIDYLNEKLVRYKLNQDNKLEEVWTCPIPVVATTYDPKSRLIYAASEQSGLFLISAEGLPLKQLSCSDWEKTELIYDIDISGSELIVACKEEGIKRFILDY